MTDPTTETAARERVQIMIRTDRGDMTVWSEPEVRAALDAYRDVVRTASSAVSLPPADQTATDGPRITRNPDGGVILHLPQITYLDTQVWAVDVGLTDEALAALAAVLPATTNQPADWDALVCEADRLRRDGAALHAKATEIDAQLAALRKQVTEPVDRAAVLREAADIVAKLDRRKLGIAADTIRDAWEEGRDAAEDVLRRMADETPADETDDARAALARVERLALTFEVAGNEFIAEQIRAAVGARQDGAQ